MPPAARAPATPPGSAPTSNPPPPCGYTVGDKSCGQPATRSLPAGSASNADPIPLCTEHAGRYLGATVPL